MLTTIWTIIITLVAIRLYKRSQRYKLKYIEQIKINNHLRGQIAFPNQELKERKVDIAPDGTPMFV